MTKKIAIIGAAASGLPAIKCCLDEGLTPVCFERSHDIGGLWNFSEAVYEGQACVMKTTVINTSKEMMCYSDFPIPQEYANFMHNTKVLEYFRLYAAHFKLLDHVRFKTEILKVTKADNFSSTGCWILTVKDLKSGDVTKETYDGVILCTGHHAEKKLPNFPGAENFKGKVVHTHDFKDHHGLEGKKVVIVGIDNSGGDCAVDLSRCCKQVYLSTRRGTWVINRIADGGIPGDMALTRRFVNQIVHIMPTSLFNKLAEAQLNRRFNHEMYGLLPEHNFNAQHLTVNDDLPNRIICGSVMIKPNISQINETSIEFEDGTREEDIDVIIYATGYKFGFPYLEPGIIDVKDNVVDLYKYTWNPDLFPASLAVIGFIQPSGAIMPIAELQCRWAAKVFKGELKLPPAQAMWSDVKAKQDDMNKRFVKSTRHTIQVDWIPFMDELAEHIGCKPQFWKLFMQNPRLAWHVWIGPCTPYQYRLMGTNTWEGAPAAIYTQWDRCNFPLKTRPTSKRDSAKGGALAFIFKIMFLVLLAAIIKWLFL